MNEHISLVALLNEVRSLLDAASGMTNAEIKLCRQYERMLADRIMFNAGWHAAGSSKLNGSASTTQLVSELSDHQKYLKTFNPKRAGRKKGSCEDWHSAFGYKVVDALAATQPDKPLASHIRYAVKEGWLDKSISDATHEQRLRRIRERWKTSYKNRPA